MQPPDPFTELRSQAKKPSLLIVSHTYLAEENRKKLSALAAHFDLTCVTCSENDAMGMRFRLADQPQPSVYRLIGLPIRGGNDKGPKFFFKGLRSVIAQNAFDFILVEAEPWAYVRWQTWLWKRIYQPRVLFGEFSWENLERRGLKGWLLAKCYRWTAATGDFVIAGNREAGAIFQKYGFGKKRILIAPQLGIDETLFAPLTAHEKVQNRLALNLPTEGFLIGFCGRFVETKGILDLIEAVKRARLELPDANLTLALLGAGPLQETLEKLAQENAWIRLLPPKSHEAVAPFFQALDLFVLPSKTTLTGGVYWKEQFGHVLIEAMSCGVATIGSDCGAIPAVVDEPEMTFPEGNIASLTAILQKLIQEPSLRTEIANRQREKTLARYSNTALAAEWASFLNHRLEKEKQSVLWVDPNLVFASPSTRHWLYSAEYLIQNGWELRGWCFECDLSPETIECKKFRQAPVSWVLQAWWFFFRVHLHGLWRWILAGRRPATIVHTVGGMYLGADITLIQFVNIIWFKKHWELGIDGFKDFLRWIIAAGGILMDGLQFKNPHCRLYHAVSDSLAKAMQPLVHPTGLVETLPNSYDESRFNPGVRQQWRHIVRQELSLTKENKTFCFSSFGHYKRKGFWLAAEALEKVRAQHPEIRFLVIGGSPKALAELQSALTARIPSWKEWILFTGVQSQVEKYLAASDAFLFPSYFETYCLAAAEAAAMGIPLLITPYFGSEMMLKDGYNGLLLEYSAESISASVEQFLTRQWGVTASAGRTLTRQQYGETLHQIYKRHLSQNSKEGGSHF